MAARVSSPRVIGRDGELARLADALDDAAGGRPRIILIGGDAGVGKTRLMAEFVAKLDPRRTPVLVGGCLAVPDGGLPYAPLTEALRRFVRESDPDVVDEVLGAARVELARLLPALTIGGPGPARRPVGRDDQARLFELVLGLLGRLGARTRDGAAVLVVEDLHWIDDATHDLLTFLARNLGDERLVVLGSFRSDANEAPPWLPAWLAELERLPPVEAMTLGPLPADALSEQLAAIIGAPPAERLRRSIVERAGGNPFFAEELLAAAMSGGGTVLPRTIREVLAARVRGLSTAAGQVARVLAIAGREIDEGLLAAAVEGPHDEAAAAIHEAIDHHVVVADPEGGVVALRHALLQETILDGLLAAERRRLHERFAEALVANPDLADPSPAGAAGELALHWAAAGRVPEAFAASQAAADAAEAVFAHGDALRHRRRALELFDRLPAEAQAPGERLRLLLRTEESADLAGDQPVARACVDQAMALADPEGDPRMAGALYGRLAYHRWLDGRSDEALEAYRTAVDLVPVSPPSLERARVLRGLGGALMGKGRYRESVAVCEQAIEAARAAGEPVEEGRALDMLGMDLVGLGDIDAGIERLRAACAIAREHDPLHGLPVGLYNLGLHLMLADRLDEALAALSEGISVVRSEGLERRFGTSLRALGADILLRLGRWDDADALVDEGRALEPAGHGSLYLRIVRVRLATARGRSDEARAVLQGAEADASGDVDYDIVAYLRAAAAELAVVEGRPADASTVADAGLGVVASSDDIFLTALLATIGLRAAADRAEAARAWHDDQALAEAAAAGERCWRALDRAGRGDEPGTPTRGLAAARALGEAERGRLGRASDPAAWLRAADRWLELGQLPPAAYARFRAAEAILVAGGDRDAAGRELRAAAESASSLGAEPLLTDIRALARRGRIALRRPAGPPVTARAMPPTALEDGALVAARREGGPERGSGERARDGSGLDRFGLSDREVEVLALVSEGRTNGEIARILFISPKTASVHVSHILDKLGAANRVEAAMLAARLGLPSDGGGRTAPRAPADARVPAGRRVAVDRRVAGGDDGDVAPGSAPPRAARAFLFTDMVGSTALVEAIGDDAWVALRAWHDATLRTLFAEHGGVEVDHAGDGFFVVFRVADAALACAVAIQRALHAHRQTSGFAPAVRVGLHWGEATRTGRGYVGRDVHLAARVAARAAGGEILASEAALRATGAEAPVDADLVRLPGITERVRIARVPWRTPTAGGHRGPAAGRG
jgi:class 3 adenylate cyclase/ATP/maltotriose-dependent transcriptional regulator MalT